MTLDEKKRFMGGYLRREDQTKTPGAGDDAARLALREDPRRGAPPLEGLLRPRRRAKTHREGDANGHFDWNKAKIGPKRMEEELAKLPSESDWEAIRSMLENRSDSERAK